MFLVRTIKRKGWDFVNCSEKLGVNILDIQDSIFGGHRWD